MMKYLKENKENNLIYDNIKKNKILMNKFNQGVRDLCTDKYRALMKEIEEDTNKWKDIPC